MIQFFKNDGLTYITHICIHIAENNMNLKTNTELKDYCDKLYSYIKDEATASSSIEMETSILYVWRTLFTAISEYTKTSIAAFERIANYIFKDMTYPKSTIKLMRFLSLSEMDATHKDAKADVDECMAYINEIELTNPGLTYVLEKRLLSAMMSNKSIFFGNVDICKVLLSKIENINDDIKHEIANLGPLVNLYNPIPAYVLED